MNGFDGTGGPRGLAGVRALGLLVDGQAQVSMNLVDYRTTPPHAVVEAIRQEAARMGTAIDRSELIGLMPRDAALAAAAEALLLPELSADQILEDRLWEGGDQRCFGKR